jgi:hypothetical protein
MDGISPIDAVRTEMTTELAVADLATDIAVFNELLDAELLSGVIALRPAELKIEDTSLAMAALSYAIGPGSGGAAVLQLIQSADAIIGKRVDFTG